MICTLPSTACARRREGDINILRLSSALDAAHVNRGVLILVLPDGGKGQPDKRQNTQSQSVQ